MIVPTNVKAASVDVHCEQCGEDTTIPFAQIKFGIGIDFLNPTIIELTCSKCNSKTFHPLSGDGRVRENVQELFVAKIKRDGCPCKELSKNNPRSDVIDHVEGHLRNTNGPDHPWHPKK